MIIAMASAAHHLALACNDASNDEKYATFPDHLQELHLYLHHSANQTAALNTMPNCNIFTWSLVLNLLV